MTSLDSFMIDAIKLYFEHIDKVFFHFMTTNLSMNIMAFIIYLK